MLALGIDPGTAICGYGVVEMKGSVMKPVFYGSILTDKDWRPEERLLKIHQDVSDIIGHFQPEFMSIEKLYFNRNVNTAIPVAQARGVVLLAAAEHNLPILEFTPMQIKKSVTGTGGAEKNQINLRPESGKGAAAAGKRRRTNRGDSGKTAEPAEQEMKDNCNK